MYLPRYLVQLPLGRQQCSAVQCEYMQYSAFLRRQMHPHHTQVGVPTVILNKYKVGFVVQSGSHTHTRARGLY